ncbi:hypothetical protein [Streptomyces sp. NEAU-H3]|uniref:hypothetical protein n=1 Tax=Streptomyces sp. NEAU-H3 TaxID=2720636 RepID=UPI00143C6891|nr:hypothetical protein [Streptomyces sp. NEAU-H3]NJA54987.1 hypothetical protein [Streptomyces sp. NEAU-H3]
MSHRPKRSAALAAAAAVLAAGLTALAPAPRALAAPPAASPNPLHYLYLGWEGDTSKPLTFPGGAVSLDHKKAIGYGLTIGGTTYAPDETENTGLRDRISWTLAEGYLPSPVSTWNAGPVRVTVQHFAHRVLDDSATAVYTRVTVTNPTATTQQATLGVGAAPSTEIPLTAKPSGTGTDSADYALSIPAGKSVSTDFVARSAGTADAAQLTGAGGFNAHYSAMAAYWKGRLAQTAVPASLPEEGLATMYKAEQIISWMTTAKTPDGQGGTNHELRSSGGAPANAPFHGYDVVYSHDAPDIAAQYIREGDFDLAKKALTSRIYLDRSSVPDHHPYLDAPSKFLYPYALYLRYTGDQSIFTPALKAKIKATAHLVQDLRVSEPGSPYDGLIKESATFDNSPSHLAVDNMAALYGLTSYADLAASWSAADASWQSERTWALGQADSVGAALDRALTARMDATGSGGYNACLDACPLLGNGNYQGNWLGTTFMMSSLPWDGRLAGVEAGGVWKDKLDASVRLAFSQRARTAPAIPAHSWGAWTNGANGYGTVYNGGAGSQLLASDDPELRTEAVADLRWLLDNQTAPMQWGESFSSGGGGTWNKNLADLEAWGLSTNRKALLEANVSVPRGGGVSIGRGVPTSWLTSGKPVSWTNVPVDGGRRIGFTLTRDGNKVSLSVTGDPGGPVALSLPAFVDDIVSTTAGTVDNASGTVTLPKGTSKVTVTVGDLEASRITGAQSTAGHYTFGRPTDQVRRYQTFTAGENTRLDGVRVSLRRIGGTGQSPVTVSLYRTSGLKPTGSPLTTTTIPASAVGTKDTVVKAALGYDGLVDGADYAVVLGQRTPGGPAYEWATSGQRGVQGFGKDTGSGWTPEPALGDAWLTAETSRPAQR